METSPSGVGGSDDPGRLVPAIRAIGARLDDIESSNRLTRLTLTGASLGIVALAALFGSSLWNTLQRQLAPEKLEAALSKKLEAIGPPLGQKLVDEVMGAVPSYSDLAVERGEKVWPELSARIAKEAETFAVDTEKMVRQRADRAVERVATKLAADLKRDFPKLSEQRCEQLAKRLEAGLITEGAGLGEEVEATIGRERARLAAMLETLPIDEAAREPDSRLQKRFMRGVLQMVDAAVETWPVDDDAAPAPRAAPADEDGVASPRGVPSAARSRAPLPQEAPSAVEAPPASDPPAESPSTGQPAAPVERPSAE